jgi:hypothetical protein
MTQRLEWDWPEEEPRRRPRIEVLPPEPEVVRVTVTHRRDNRAQRWVMAAAMFVLALILWRFKFMLLLAVAMAPNFVGMLAMAIVIVAVIAWRERRHNKPF